MPTNSQSEGIIYGLNGVPLLTYGMIGITTLVLAYVTMMDIEKPIELAENSVEKFEQITGTPVSELNPLNPMEEQMMNEPEPEQMPDSEEEPLEQQAEEVPDEEAQLEEQPEQAVPTEEQQPKQGGKKKTRNHKKKLRKRKTRTNKSKK